MKKKLNLAKKFQTRQINVPELVIGEEEQKPFTMWALITKSKAEFKLKWKFWGIGK